MGARVHGSMGAWEQRSMGAGAQGRRGARAHGRMGARARTFAAAALRIESRAMLPGFHMTLAVALPGREFAALAAALLWSFSALSWSVAGKREIGRASCRERV